MSPCGGRVHTRPKDEVTLQVGSWSKSWEMPFVEELD